MLGGESTLARLDPRYCSREVRSVTTGDFTSKEDFEMAGFARCAWFCIVGILVLAALGIAALWATVQLSETMGYLSWIVLSAFYPLGSAARGFGVRLLSAIRDGCDAEVFVRSDSSSSNRYLVQAMISMLRQIALHGKAELTVERIVEAKSDFDISAWRPLLRPWNQKALLYVTSATNFFVVEVTSCNRDGVVCGPKHELSHPVDFKIRVRASSVFEFLTLALRLQPQDIAPRQGPG